MRCGALAILLLLLLPRSALAAQETGVKPAPDGTLIVLGSGWRPSDEILVTLGDHRFMAYTDSTGSFELYTGLDTFEGALTARRSEGAALPPVESDRPHPMAVLLAESIAKGTVLLAVWLLVLAALTTSARALRRKRG